MAYVLWTDYSLSLRRGGHDGRRGLHGPVQARGSADRGAGLPDQGGLRVAGSQLALALCVGA